MIRTLLRLAPDSAQPAIRRYVALLIVVVLTRAGSCVLLVPVLSRLASDAPGDAWPWIGALVAAAAAYAITQFAVARTGFELGLAVMDGQQARIIEHLGEVPVGWATGPGRTASHKSLTTTGALIAQSIGNLVTPAIVAVALPVAIGLALLPVAWQLGLAALVGSPLLLLAFWAGNRCSRQADEAFADSLGELDARLLEFARAQRTLRSSRRADPDSSPAGVALAGQHGAALKVLRWSIPGQLLFTVASQLALFGLALTALALLRSGDVSVPEAIGLLVVAVRFLEPFTTLAELAPALQSSSLALAELDTVLDAPVLAGDGEGSADGGPPEVRLDGVRYRHDGAAEVTIDGVDLVAPAGLTTAIVGPSGAGKSTLLSLVARFADADGGTVSVGGRDVRSLAPAALHRSVSAVFQEVHLVEGTIRENVLLGDPSADDARLAEVAALARVDEILERLPAGWDTPVGEGGVALSGGERQRVGIARALLKPAPLLLVDEATSSLDAENEAAIVEALAASRGRRTTIVVAHRMRTIAEADHVVFVDRGKVVEAGPRDQLLAAGGRFAAFHRDQVASAAWTLGRH